MARRLPRIDNEWLDRQRRLHFYFEGRQYEGFEGDTVTSALLANGVLTLGRSFKYHRPRSTLSFSNHDINVLLQDSQRHNIRGDIESLTDNADYRAINTLFGVKYDALQILEKLAAFLPVGFYYKAFYKPSRLFPLWEKLFRHVAGLGKVNSDAALRRLPAYTRYCDVLIVGAGASGLSAAMTALDAGADVVLVDEQARPGGSLNDVSSAEAQTLLARFNRDYRQHDRLTCFTHTVASGFYSDNWLAVHAPNASYFVHADAVILATGLIEMPFVFRNNDRPGVFLLGAIQRLVHRHAVCPFDEAVVVVGNDDSYEAIQDLLEQGVSIKSVLDIREQVSDVLVSRLAEAGIEHRIGIVPAEVVVNHGRVKAFAFNHDKQLQQINCDAVLMAAGFTPAAQLFYQSGGRMHYDDNLEQLVPASSPEAVFLAGRVNGLFNFDDRCQDGRAAAVEALAQKFKLETTATRPDRDKQSHSVAYPIFPHEKGKEFFDFDEDIQIRDLELACREGFDNIELIKRYTTIGMGPSQGKHSNMNGIRFLASYLQQSIDETGSTTARPFYHPVPIKNLAGRRIRREWRTPLHFIHQQQQADFVESGHWLRPAYYQSSAGNREQAIRTEYRAVRERLGIIDVSTLGKIEIFGEDAIELLESVYTCKLSMLQPGQTRYLVMVDDAGVVIDDGVAACLDKQHFYITTTTGHAAASFRQLKQNQARLLLNAEVVDMTTRYAALNLAGRHSASTLAPLIDISLRSDDFPYLACREANFSDIPVKIMRVGFVGELSYELHFPVSYAHFIWQSLIQAGESSGIQPFGVETQRRLRLEKGHCIVGQDTDGLTHPYEAGLGWNVHLDKPGFIGKAALSMHKQRIERKLIGFKTEYQSEQDPIEESLLILEGDAIKGRVTSVDYSPGLNCSIGMVMLEHELAVPGNPITIRLASGQQVTATLCRMPLFDPEGERQQLDELTETDEVH